VPREVIFVCQVRGRLPCLSLRCRMMRNVIIVMVLVVVSVIQGGEMDDENDDIQQDKGRKL